MSIGYFRLRFIYTHCCSSTSYNGQLIEEQKTKKLVAYGFLIFRRSFFAMLKNTGGQLRKRSKQNVEGTHARCAHSTTDRTHMLGPHIRAVQ